MTTILCDARMGIMAADSQWSDGVQKGRVRKVHRIGKQLIGCAGNLDETTLFLAWCRKGCQGKPPKIPNFSALVLNAKGLFHCVGNDILMPVESGWHAIGSGAVAAMCTHEALGFNSPRLAVALVCKHDAGSRGPVRVYHL